MTHFALPYAIGADGRTQGSSREDYVRDLIELVLFTARGERVNRPDFGAGLKQFLFEGNAPEIAASTQHLIQAALQRFLADLMEVKHVAVQAHGATLEVTVAYQLLDETEVRAVTLTREV